jgi:hypothetical protein
VPAAHTVLVAVAGVALLKDLCQSHLYSLLEGSRDADSN